MNQNDVIREIGRFPDEINPTTRMKSKKWKCAKRCCIYEFIEEKTSPAPCKKCNSVIFEKQ